jgi:hypothetical protein
MKQRLFIFLSAITLFSCGSNSQHKAISDTPKVSAALEQPEPGHIPVTEGGWAMTAKIDGKPWAATSFRSPEETDWINGDYKEESIKLPFYKKYMIVGNKTAFSDTRMTQLFLDDDVTVWSGRKGEMEITKVDGQWVEGKFFFTASSSTKSKTIEVTDGFFRISLARNK